MATTATEGKVIKALVVKYGELVDSNDSGIRAWWREAAKTSNVRDLAATIKAAKELGEIRGIKPAYANNARLAVSVFDIAGADMVSVVDLMKVVEVAQRALKVEGALELVSRVESFNEFEAKAREAESLRKASKTPRAKTSKAGEVSTSYADADSLISAFLAQWGDLEDVTITDLDSAEKLAGALKVAIQSSKSLKAKSKANHPTAKANA